MLHCNFDILYTVYLLIGIVCVSIVLLYIVLFHVLPRLCVMYSLRACVCIPWDTKQNTIAAQCTYPCTVEAHDGIYTCTQRTLTLTNEVKQITF